MIIAAYRAWTFATKNGGVPFANPGGGIGAPRLDLGAMENQRALDICEKFGFTVVGNFMVGSTQEDGGWDVVM